MSTVRLLIASLLYHWRTNLAVACGVAVGTAVLTGALLVGDSMRGSLRHLTLDRLGRIDEALVSDHFFRAALADELSSKPDEKDASAAPAILLPASLESADPQSPARANRVALIGCDERFWQLGLSKPQPRPQWLGIVLNRPLAEQLGVRPGDTVLLRLPRPGAIAADSALGRKGDNIRTQRLMVTAVIAAEGLGRFGLRPTQRLPYNAYVPLPWLQEVLEQPGRANAILVADHDGKIGTTEPVGDWSIFRRESEFCQQTSTENMDLSPSAAPGGQSHFYGENVDSHNVVNRAAKIGTVPFEQLPRHRTWRPQLADYGLRVDRTARGYWNVTSDRMVLDPATEKAILEALSRVHARSAQYQPAMTYLANTLSCNGREIPYSTITAIDFADRPPLGPFLSAEGKPLPALGPDEIALNSWAADDLKARVGDTVRLSYFEPESVDGQVREKTVSLRLVAVVQLSGAADDRALTPAVKGITDELTMADWDPPFPFDARRIRPADEKYWDRHGATPKAFVSLATGHRLWGSRFGQTTSLRIAETEGDWARLLQENLDAAAMGMVFQPVKRQGLAAAAGTTPFGVLFLCFSFFLIAAAVMLVALLFRLGIEQRAAEMGTLLALGWSRRQVGHLLLGEGLAVAALGSLAGVPAGIGYAALLLLGLRTWWLAAVVTPFLRLYVTAASLAIGSLSGLIIVFAVIWLLVRRMARVPPRRLLAGLTSFDGRLQCYKTPHHCNGGEFGGRHFLEIVLLFLAIAPPVALLFGRLSEQVRAGAFFASGAVALLALLLLVWIRLEAGMTGPAVAAGGGNLTRMALRNAARNPGRSTLTIGLVAAATFLIVALSAFRVDPTMQTPTLHSSNGGFALAAESNQPILRNLNTPEGRSELGFLTEDERLLAGSTIVSLRAGAGDDASCLNLYRSRQPRVLGVPPVLVQRDGFAWADAPRDAVNPWKLLNPTVDDGLPTRVILEKNTANYALNLWGGLGETFEIADGRGRPLRLQVVALLADSIFQGDLLIGQRAFLQHFPDVSGYRFFLVDTLPGQAAAAQKVLERNLGDYGFSAETTGRRMADFLAVQNTYLSTFQSLGGLGLLLGTFGLAAVQLRSVFERRGELALLRAAGFRRSMLARLVLLEHTVLLMAGLGIGVAAALLSVLPQWLVRLTPLPWASLAGTLAAVLVVGLAAGGLAVRAVLRAPLLATLREERP